MKTSPNRVPTVELLRRPTHISPDAPTEHARHMREAGGAIPELKRIADWMDSAFRVPGLNVKFGLDAILGLFPGFGDTVASLVSLYILHAANRRGVSRLTMTRMALN